MKQHFGRKLFLKLKGAFAAALAALKARFAALRLQPNNAVSNVVVNNFIARSFMHIAGSLKYHVFTPSNYSAGMPLLVMLHGCKQDGETFATGTRMNQLAEQHGFVVLYPTQSRMANVNQCWNWYQSINQHRNMGEPAVIADMTREIVATYSINPAKVFIAGLSAGGAMAYIVGSQYPELYAGIGVHSGLPYKSATDVASAFAAMRGDPGIRGQRKPRRPAANDPRMRTIVFHGDADRIVHPSNAAKIIEAQAQPGDSVERAKARSSASRAYTRAVTRDKTGSAVVEQWLIHGSGHAWSGGSPDGTYTDPHGPDASREMLRFSLEETR